MLYSCSVSIQFYNKTPLGGGGEERPTGKAGSYTKQGLQIQIHIGWAGGLKNAMEGFLGTVKINEYVWTLPYLGLPLNTLGPHFRFRGSDGILRAWLGSEGAGGLKIVRWTTGEPSQGCWLSPYPAIVGWTWIWIPFFKNLVKKFSAMVSLYSHQLITMHDVHFATLKPSSKMTFLVPKNPFLTYKSILS